MDFNVNVNVKFDATPALAGVVSTLAGVMNPAKEVTQPLIADMPRPVQAQAVKAELPATQAPAIVETAVKETTQTAEATPVVSEQPVQEATGEITDEMLRKIVGPISKSKGKDAVFKILGEFGVNRVPDLKQEQRQAFIDKLNEL